VAWLRDGSFCKKAAARQPKNVMNPWKLRRGRPRDEQSLEAATGPPRKDEQLQVRYQRKLE
jgi:hypothetical protein